MIQYRELSECRKGPSYRRRKRLERRETWIEIQGIEFRGLTSYLAEYRFNVIPNTCTTEPRTAKGDFYPSQMIGKFAKGDHAGNYHIELRFTHSQGTATVIIGSGLTPVCVPEGRCLYLNIRRLQ